MGGGPGSEGASWKEMFYPGDVLFKKTIGAETFCRGDFLHVRSESQRFVTLSAMLYDNLSCSNMAIVIL
jgi:hypothetical protein